MTCRYFWLSATEADPLCCSSGFPGLLASCSSSPVTWLGNLRLLVCWEPGLECKAPPRLWPAFCEKKTANIVSLLENKHTNKNPQAQNIQTEIGRKKNPATKGKYCTAKQLGRAYVATLSYTFILGHAVSVLVTHGCQSESHVFDQMHGNT